MKYFWIIFVIALIGTVCGLTNYKSEELQCSKSENVCCVIRTNLFNMKSEKKIINYSDIKKVSYIRQKVKGNLYAKGYTDYQLIFTAQDNSRKIIFSEVFFDFDTLKAKMKEIRKKMNSSEDNFVIFRD